jgi:hypothetical protein
MRRVAFSGLPPRSASLRPYSLLFLGHPTFTGTLSLDDSNDCWQLITVALHNCLNRLEHVHYSFRNNYAGRSEFYDELPQVDAVLFWGVPQIWMSYDHRRLRRATECRAIITVCERAIRESSDWRFVFDGEGKSTTRVTAPVWKQVYNYAEKTPKTILIDHWDQDTPSDWTLEIEKWIRELSPEFHITWYVQDGLDRRMLQGGEKSSETRRLPRAPYPEWLAATDRLETFVMTHRESYGYGVLDMFARGTRVVCPTPFLPSHFKDRFYIDTFNTKQELVEILRQRPDPLKLIRNKFGLSDWFDVSKLIDDRFQVLLGNKYRNSLRTVGRLLGM